MADLGSKKIGSNYHKLLQIDGTVQDGSGSNASIIMGAGKHISGSATTTGSFGRVETQTISASSGQFDAGTVYVGNVAMSENSAGGVTFSDGDNRELGALQGNGYFILSCSTAVNVARPLFNMTQQVGTTQNANIAQIKMSDIRFYIDQGDKQWMYGAHPSGSAYQGDFFLNDNFTLAPSPASSLKSPAFYITASNKYWGIGTFPNSINMVRISGSLFVEGPVGDITASGNISASGTIYANDFQSATGGSGIDFNDNLDVSGNLVVGGTTTLNDNLTISASKSLIIKGIASQSSSIAHEGGSALTFRTKQSMHFRPESIFRVHEGLSGTGVFTINPQTSAQSSIGARTVQVAQNGTFEVTGSGGFVELYRGDITASGNINASGTITANQYGGNISGSVTSTGSFGELEVDTNATVDGDVKVAQYIKHKGNETTFINFTDNRIRFKAGDIGFLDMEKDDSTPYPATVNPGGNRINFRVVDRNTDLLLKTDSELFKVNLYHAGNQKLETATDGINVTGQVSASGVLKADTGISSSNATFTGTIKDFTIVSGSRLSTGSLGRLDIGGAGATQADIVIKGTQPELSVVSTNSATDPQIQLTNTPNGIDWSIGADASDSDKLKIDAGWYPGQNTKLTIVSASGNIGVGTRIPVEKLQVAGNISASGYLATTTGVIKESAGTTRLTLGSTNTFVGNVSASGTLISSGISSSKNVIAHGTNPYFLAQESTYEFLKMGVEATTGDMMIGWDDSDDLHLGVLNNPSDTTLNTKMLISSTGQVGIGTENLAFQNARLTVNGIFVASGSTFKGNTSVDGVLTSSKANFTNLPTNPNAAGVYTGDLYTLSGSQLPFATGSVGSSVRALFNQYSASKFVLIK